MPLDLVRIDDRLIHGQVVVGWGQPLGIGFIVLVDDDVVNSDWEQELYRMGVPPEMDLFFDSVEEAARRLPMYRDDRRVGILLTAEIATMARLVGLAPDIRAVTVGGIHHKTGRTPRLRYVFLTPAEEQALLDLEKGGVVVTAQDVPSAAPMPLAELLVGDGSG